MKNQVSGMKVFKAATQNSIWTVTSGYSDTALMHTLIYAHTYYG